MQTGLSGWRLQRESACQDVGGRDDRHKGVGVGVPIHQPVILWSCTSYLAWNASVMALTHRASANGIVYKMQCLYACDATTTH
jgi:hypothetical protein